MNCFELFLFLFDDEKSKLDQSLEKEENNNKQDKFCLKPRQKFRYYIPETTSLAWDFLQPQQTSLVSLK